MARRFVDNQETVDHLVWAGGLTMSWFSSLLGSNDSTRCNSVDTSFGTMAEDSALWVSLQPPPSRSLDLSTPMTARVKRVDIPIAGLSDALNGFTIVQITDVHVGPTIKSDYVHRIVKGQQSGCVVAITGDMVDNTVDILKDHTAPLGELRARHGSYVVTGNHEYYFELTTGWLNSGDWDHDTRR